jgi:hypothetical protein
MQKAFSVHGDATLLPLLFLRQVLPSLRHRHVHIHDECTCPLQELFTLDVMQSKVLSIDQFVGEVPDGVLYDVTAKTKSSR